MAETTSSMVSYLHSRKRIGGGLPSSNGGKSKLGLLFLVLPHRIHMAPLCYLDSLWGLRGENSIQPENLTGPSK